MGAAFIVHKNVVVRSCCGQENQAGVCALRERQQQNVDVSYAAVHLQVHSWYYHRSIRPALIHNDVLAFLLQAAMTHILLILGIPAPWI